MNKEPIFSGVCTALITPFKGNTVDYKCLEALIERQIAAGVAAIAVCGTTGESATLSVAEHRRVIRFACETVKGRIPLIAGTGSNDTRHAISMSTYAREVGADALLTVTPYYNKATQEGLYRSFSAIANATDLPIILYNVPTRTCVDISPDTYKRLSEIPNIVAVKEASTSISKMLKTMELCQDRLTLYSGNDDMTLPMLSIGAKGVVSVLSNLMPEQMCDLYKAWERKDTERARKAQCELSPIMQALFCEVNPAPVKYAMSLYGLCREDLRLPMCPLSEDNKKMIRTLLRLD